MPFAHSLDLWAVWKIRQGERPWLWDRTDLAGTSGFRESLAGTGDGLPAPKYCCLAVEFCLAWANPGLGRPWTPACCLPDHTIRVITQDRTLGVAQKGIPGNGIPDVGIAVLAESL